ncbi:hypothetical protein WJX79_002027 [Trebouxia sp. C0005]
MLPGLCPSRAQDPLTIFCCTSELYLADVFAVIGPSHQAPLYRRRAEPSVVIEELPLDEQEEPPKPKASSELSTGHSAHQQAISASNITAMPLGPASAEATGGRDRAPAKAHAGNTTGVALAAPRSGSEFELLEGLKSVPRFDMIVMSLPKREKAALKEQFDAAQNAGVLDSVVENRLGNVRRSYRV